VKAAVESDTVNDESTEEGRQSAGVELQELPRRCYLTELTRLACTIHQQQATPPPSLALARQQYHWLVVYPARDATASYLSAVSRTLNTHPTRHGTAANSRLHLSSPDCSTPLIRSPPRNTFTCLSSYLPKSLLPHPSAIDCCLSLTRTFQLYETLCQELCHLH
jgi:hypothetical protein